MPDNSEEKRSMETASTGSDPISGEIPTNMSSVKDRPVLLASVIIMGVLIVVGLIVVFGTIIYRVTSGPSTTAQTTRGVFGSVDVRVANGTSLLGTTLVEDKLSVVTSANGAVEVIIFDTKRGVELGRVRLVAEGDTPVSVLDPAPVAGQ